MKFLRMRVLRVFGVALLTFGFLYLAFRGTHIDRLFEALSTGNYLIASIVIPVLLLSDLFRAWRWKYLLAPLKGNTKVRNLFSATMIGYMINNFVPRLGELVRPYALGRLEHVSKSAALGTIVVERVIDIMTFLLLLGGLLIFDENSLSSTFPWLSHTGFVVFFITLFLLLVLYLLVKKKEPVLQLYRRLFRFLPLKMFEKGETLLSAFVDGFRVIRQPRFYIMIAILSIVIWGLYLLMMYVPFYAFGLAHRGLGLGAAAILLAVSSISVAVPTPGGTGTFHSLITETLVRLYGVNHEVALSYATVTHGMGYIGVTVVGIIYFLRYNIHISEAMAAEAVIEAEVNKESAKQQLSNNAHDATPEESISTGEEHI
ncbi:MAG: lysylphosphatidylglycerol synthase transmembrane domain-containing protein [Bacteroidota bacterium]